MGRSIKFRAWDKHTKRFIPDAELQVHALGATPMGGGINKTLEILSLIYEVGQFTGLCDRNGKEIYEGDILMSSHSFPLHKHVNPWAVEYSVDNGFGLSESAASDYEIVGNIYENPDILTLRLVGIENL